MNLLICISYYFVYLTIEFVKLDGEWKIHAYYLQP